MLSVGVTESAAILEKSPVVFVQFEKILINALTRESFSCRYDIVVPLILRQLKDEINVLV